MGNTYDDDVTYKVDLSGPLPKVEPSTFNAIVAAAKSSPSSRIADRPRTVDDEVIEEAPRPKRKTAQKRTRSVRKAP